MMSAGAVSGECYMILLLLRQLRACTRDVPGSWVILCHLVSGRSGYPGYGYEWLTVPLEIFYEPFGWLLILFDHKIQLQLKITPVTEVQHGCFFCPTQHSHNAILDQNTWKNSNKNLICHRLLSMPRDPVIVYCGILFNIPYYSSFTWFYRRI